MRAPVMHATDFSSASRPAFAKAVQLARRDRTGLVIAHVMTPPTWVGDGYIAPSTLDSIYRGYRQDSQKKLDAVVARAKAAGVRARGMLLEGIPGEQILRAAKASKAGLVVVGTHGRTGVARFFLGSVAGRVVAGAACPVVTVRGK
jgi:nucleotide-binding universal stress UspA family protein